METDNPKVEINAYDKEEIYHDCTVQVLTNTVTGEVSIGWWRNEKKPKGWRDEDARPPCTMPQQI